MQTFLPYADFDKTAKVLDYRRLGKQRVEAKQIYLALTEPVYGWKNHPAVKMWRGYEIALCNYGVAICKEWIQRGYKDSLLPFFTSKIIPNTQLPWWLGDEKLHRSHRAALKFKNPEHYRRFRIEPKLEYWWPV